MALPIPALPGYHFRFARLDDVPAIHQMLVRISEVDRTGFVDALEDMTSQFCDSWSNPEEDYLLAFTPDGHVAGLGRSYLNPSPRQERNANLWGEVHPDHRGRGLGHTILNWMEARALARLQKYPADLPRALRINCLDYLADRIQLFEQHGFKPLRSWYRMRRDLSQPIPDLHLPPALALRTYHPDLDQALMDAFNESFSDHWSFEPTNHVDWQMFLIQASAFRPELTFLAMDGEGGQAQIAGFAINFIREEDNRRQGVAEGIITELGTRPAWRKRGIASALVCESMRAFKALGLDYAGLGVDAETTTGALGIYERLGFTVLKRQITFYKPVD
jgi:ribosomal protein S18 acetylase RimI-like enzyme